MTIIKPRNRVTDRMFDRMFRGADPTGLSVPRELPVLSADDLKALEENFPERCYDPSSESLEDHLMYTGSVLLVLRLRQAYDNRPMTGANGVEVGEDGELKTTTDEG